MVARLMNCTKPCRNSNIPLPRPGWEEDTESDVKDTKFEGLDWC